MITLEPAAVTLARYPTPAGEESAPPPAGGELHWSRGPNGSRRPAAAGSAMAEKDTRTDLHVLGSDSETQTTTQPNAAVESTVRTVITGASSADWNPAIPDGWSDRAEPLDGTGAWPEPTLPLAEMATEDRATLARPPIPNPITDEVPTQRVPTLEGPSRSPPRREHRDAPSWDEDDGFSDGMDAFVSGPSARPGPLLTRRERTLLWAAAAAGLGAMTVAYVVGRWLS